MKHSLFFFLLVFLVFFPLHSTDRDIAIVYQSKIWDFIESDAVMAQELLESAFSYDRDLSGLWYAQGILQENENSLISAVGSYQKAMDLDDWQGGDYDSFLNRYFALLSRLGLWDTILEQRERIGFYRVNNNQVLLSSAWADFYLGNEKEAEGKASRGINLYPEDSRFYTIQLACHTDKMLMESYLFYWGKNEESLFSTSYTLYKINRLPRELEEYYILEVHDDFARFLELKRNLLNKKADLLSLSFYLENQNRFDLDLLRDLYHLYDSEGKSLIENTLLNFSGEYYSDQDGDFYNELILNKDRELLVDRNRDGLYETQIELTPGGLPQFWKSELNIEGVREISFFNWPLIKEVKRDTAYGEQSFQFLYSHFSLDREGLSEFLYDQGEFSLMGMMEVMQKKDITIPWESLLQNCYTLQEFKEENLFRTYLLHKGEILAIEEDSQGKGIMDRQVLMKDGEVLAARRDLDGDGKYDLFEYYEKGIWKGYAINLNGKTWSDFYHDWSVIPIKIWDFENDHVINSYTLESLKGDDMIIEPQIQDVIGVDDLLYWEKIFEAHWYR